MDFGFDLPHGARHAVMDVNARHCATSEAVQDQLYKPAAGGFAGNAAKAGKGGSFGRDPISIG